jgi:predicted restriction endonuclease
MNDRTKCGTNAGYQAHKKAGEVPCEPCRLASNKYQREYRNKNRDRVREQEKNRYRRDPQKAHEAVKRWSEKNPGKMSSYVAKWSAANPEKLQEAQRKYRESDRGKEAARRNSAKRRAYKRSNISEPYTEKDVLETYGNKCHICGLEVDLTAPRSQAQNLEGWQKGLQIDHLIPLSKNGPDTLENVRPAHALCNLKKSNK